MPRIVFFITFFGLFLINLSQNHVFAASSPYSVKGVEVDVLDESSVKARNKAFIDAQRKAFEVLSTRYYAPGELDVLKVPTDETLSGFIQDFKIASEQVSSKRYKGVFDFRFKPAAVNQYFGRGPINFVSDAAPEVKKVLLIPYYHEEKKTIIFNKSQNPFWGSLLQDIANFNTVILPDGSIQDLTDIGDKNPTYMSPVTIRRLKARYDVTSIAVATASVNLQDQSKINIDVQDASSGKLVPIANFDAAPADIAKGALAAVAQIAVPQKAVPIVDNTDTNTDVNQADIPQSEINPDHFALKGGQGRVSLSAREQMIKQQQAMIAAGSGQPTKATDQPVQRGMETADQAEAAANAGEANVQVYFNSMSEWIALQKDLSRLDGIKGIRIVTLKTNQGDTVIEYSDWNKFLASLKASGYTLTSQDADTYVLKRAAANF